MCVLVRNVPFCIIFLYKASSSILVEPLSQFLSFNLQTFDIFVFSSNFSFMFAKLYGESKSFQPRLICFISNLCTKVNRECTFFGIIVMIFLRCIIMILRCTKLYHNHCDLS